MTHVYLIRHAQQFSAHNDLGLLLADQEDGLTEKGHAQARRLAERVANEIQPDVLYCSPLLRARQTARHVNDATGLPLNIDPSLAELASIARPMSRPPSNSMAGCAPGAILIRPPFPGGEALADLQRRGAQAFEQIAQTHRSKSIVIITHGGLIEMVFYSSAGHPDRTQSGVVRALRPHQPLSLALAGGQGPQPGRLGSDGRQRYSPPGGSGMRLRLDKVVRVVAPGVKRVYSLVLTDDGLYLIQTGHAGA